MLWEAWKISKAYRRPPSEIYHVTDELTAWSFDRAVYLFGTEVEADLRDAVSKAKNKTQQTSKQMAVMAKWMGRQMRFRDPAGSGKKAAPKTVSSESAGHVSL